MEIIDTNLTQVAAYTPFYADLAKLEEDNTKVIFDYESKKGNAEARSHVHKLRLSKGALERTRKAEKSESLKIGKAIDSEAAALEVRIEAMIKVHQDEIDKIEKREADRVAELKERVQWFGIIGVDAVTSAQLTQAIDRIEREVIGDDFEEFKADALILKDSSLQALRVRRFDAIKKEEEAAELARLRAEALAREQADRDAAIAKAAEDRAKAEAEAKADKLAAAAAKAIQDAENKASAEREASARRELELKLAAETAERRRVEQEQAATQAKIDAEARSKRQAAEAVEREKERVAAVARAEAAELAKREANKAHKGKVNRTALAALVEGGMTEECAKLCITLIASGKVPAIAINY